MIRYFYRTSKTKIKYLEAFNKDVWVYCEAPTDEEVKDLINQLELDAGHIEDALDEDEMPRIEREDSQLYLFTRIPLTNDDLRLGTTPLLFVLGEGYILTICNRPLPRIDKFLDDKIIFSTAHPDQLMLIILNEIIEQYDSYLNQVSRQIKAIRSRLRIEEISNKDFVDFVLVEDELNEFLSALTPTSAILRRLLISKHLKLSDDDRDLVEDLLLANEQSIEATRSNTKSIVNIREAYSTIMSNNLNRVIRVLTVLTVILAIPTLIGSLYGMNVKLPLDTANYTFGIIIILSLLISLALIWYFRKRNWL